MGNNQLFGLGSAGTLQVNSQLIPTPMIGAFYPNNASAPFYRGSGQIPPTLPLNYGPTAATDGQATAASAQPWNPATSPLPIAVVSLVVGMLGLRYVHWRG